MRKINTKRIIVSVAIGIVAGLLPLLMIGCDLLGVSIEKRIEYFLDDMNNDRANGYTNFHPTETSYYVLGTIKAAGFWDTDFPSGTPQYSLASINDSNPSSVIATINGPTSLPAFGRGGTGTDTLEFVMIADGTNWLIEEIYYWGGTADLIVE
jgi:hypothetical protein